ncbi:hypothetical protein [Clostridium puniceum]|nr:hypothetical protein [Clostridium puniceum]
MIKSLRNKNNKPQIERNTDKFKYFKSSTYVKDFFKSEARQMSNQKIGNIISTCKKGVLIGHLGNK